MKKLKKDCRKRLRIIMFATILLVFLFNIYYFSNLQSLSTVEEITFDDIINDADVINYLELRGIESQDTITPFVVNVLLVTSIVGMFLWTTSGAKNV